MTKFTVEKFKSMRVWHDKGSSASNKDVDVKFLLPNGGSVTFSPPPLKNGSRPVVSIESLSPVPYRHKERDLLQQEEPGLYDRVIGTLEKVHAQYVWLLRGPLEGRPVLMRMATKDTSQKQSRVSEAVDPAKFTAVPINEEKQLPAERLKKSRSYNFSNFPPRPSLSKLDQEAPLWPLKEFVAIAPDPNSLESRLPSPPPYIPVAIQLNFSDAPRNEQGLGSKNESGLSNINQTNLKSHNAKLNPGLEKEDENCTRFGNSELNNNTHASKKHSPRTTKTNYSQKDTSSDLVTSPKPVNTSAQTNCEQTNTKPGEEIDDKARPKKNFSTVAKNQKIRNSSTEPPSTSVKYVATERCKSAPRSKHSKHKTHEPTPTTSTTNTRKCRKLYENSTSRLSKRTGESTTSKETGDVQKATEETFQSCQSPPYPEKFAPYVCIQERSVYKRSKNGQTKVSQLRSNARSSTCVCTTTAESKHDKVPFKRDLRNITQFIERAGSAGENAERFSLILKDHRHGKGRARGKGVYLTDKV